MESNKLLRLSSKLIQLIKGEQVEYVGDIKCVRKKIRMVRSGCYYAHGVKVPQYELKFFKDGYPWINNFSSESAARKEMSARIRKGELPCKGQPSPIYVDGHFVENSDPNLIGLYSKKILL